jgi:hypothetical protein
MNLILLGVGLRAWQGPPLRAVSSILVAVATLTLEMQAVTWFGIGSLRQLVFINAGLAAAGLLWLRVHWALKTAFRLVKCRGPLSTRSVCSH